MREICISACRIESPTCTYRLYRVEQINPAKFSDTCSMRADGLCIGSPRLVGWRKAGNSNLQELFCTTLHKSTYGWGYSHSELTKSELPICCKTLLCIPKQVEMGLVQSKSSHRLQNVPIPGFTQLRNHCDETLSLS